MKYRGIELLENKDSAAELLIHIFVPENTDGYDYNDDGEFLSYEFCSDLEDYMRDLGVAVETEHEVEKLICVRSRERIPFDKNGVDFLMHKMYENVLRFVDDHGGVLDVKIGVHVDGPGEAYCFFKDNGDWYNEDLATPKEFLARIEY